MKKRKNIGRLIQLLTFAMIVALLSPQPMRVYAQEDVPELTEVVDETVPVEVEETPVLSENEIVWEEEPLPAEEMLLDEEPLSVDDALTEEEASVVTNVEEENSDALTIEEEGFFPDEEILSEESSMAVKKSDALNWLRAQEGVLWDVDGQWPGQCTDFVTAYMNYVVTGNPRSGTYTTAHAKNYDSIANRDPGNWEVIQNYYDFIPQPGDIFVTTGSNAAYGHTGVVLSSDINNATVVDQNARDASGNGSTAWVHYIGWNGAYAPRYYIRFRNWAAEGPSWTPEDFGTNVYVHITQQANWIGVEVTPEGNVQLHKTALNNDDPRLVWRLDRQADKSYKIVSAYDGRVLDVDEANTASGTNLKVYTDTGNRAQRFFIWCTDNTGFRISTALDTNKVMDVGGGSIQPGANIQIWTSNNTNAQKFAIDKITDYAKPEKPAAPQVAVKTDNSNMTTVSWAEVPKVSRYDYRTYTVQVKKTNGSDAGKLVIDKTGLTALSVSQKLAAGTYSVVVRAVNNFYPDYYTDSKAYTFTISNSDEKLRNFVTRAYSLMLGRKPDTKGLNYWVGELKAKRIGGGQMCAQFLASREFQNKKYAADKIVDICYQSFFDRTADASGKKHWKDLLENGMSTSYIARGMAGSNEFKNICTSYGITPGSVSLTQNRDRNEKVTAFVARCYKESLGRLGDVDGLNYWTGALLSKKVTPAKVAEQFVFSKEMTGKKLNNTNFVKMLYRLCMNRNFDQTGLNYWLGQMNKGMSRQRVFTSFVQSREFQNIVKGYGL